MPVHPEAQPLLAALEESDEMPVMFSNQLVGRHERASGAGRNRAGPRCRPVEHGDAGRYQTG